MGKNNAQCCQDYMAVNLVPLGSQNQRIPIFDSGHCPLRFSEQFGSLLCEQFENQVAIVVDIARGLCTISSYVPLDLFFIWRDLLTVPHFSVTSQVQYTLHGVGLKEHQEARAGPE